MSNTYLKPGSTIGILGGGQLGRMLSLSASQLGFKSHIFDPHIDAPAKQVTNLSSTFDYTDLKGLTKFANKVDVIELMPQDRYLGRRHPLQLSVHEPSRTMRQARLGRGDRNTGLRHCPRVCR